MGMDHWKEEYFCILNSVLQNIELNCQIIFNNETKRHEMALVKKTRLAHTSFSWCVTIIVDQYKRILFCWYWWFSSFCFISFHNEWKFVARNKTVLVANWLFACSGKICFELFVFKLYHLWSSDSRFHPNQVGFNYSFE